MIDIEQLAREAGFGNYASEARSIFERFAALVRNEVLEEAAKVADDCICDVHIPTGHKIYGTRAARAIRALKQ